MKAFLASVLATLMIILPSVDTAELDKSFENNIVEINGFDGPGTKPGG